MSTQSRQRRREGGAYRRISHTGNGLLPLESQSLVEICGRYWTKCGYCKPDTKTSLSYGLLAKRLTCADYQELIDRGWRRSGTFVYKAISVKSGECASELISCLKCARGFLEKQFEEHAFFVFHVLPGSATALFPKPVMHETCCPQYTIRLDVSKFKPSKAQRHVLNRVRRYLEGDRDQGGCGKVTPTSSAGNSNGHGSQGGNPVTSRNGRSHPNRDGVRDDSDNAVPGPNGSSTDPNNGSNRSNRQEVGGKLQTLTRITAKAVTEAVAEAPALSELNLVPGWESNLVKWAQVKPIRGKSCQLLGDGFCSTIALSVASAARKRGWRGVGDAGGAVTIAEAVVQQIGRRHGDGWGARPQSLGGVTVAPNGFINFASDVVEALMSAQASQLEPESSSKVARPAGKDKDVGVGMGVSNEVDDDDDDDDGGGGGQQNQDDSCGVLRVAGAVSGADAVVTSASDRPMGGTVAGGTGGRGTGGGAVGPPTRSRASGVSRGISTGLAGDAVADVSSEMSAEDEGGDLAERVTEKRSRLSELGDAFTSGYEHDDEHKRNGRGEGDGSAMKTKGGGALAAAVAAAAAPVHWLEGRINDCAMMDVAISNDPVEGKVSKASSHRSEGGLDADYADPSSNGRTGSGLSSLPQLDSRSFPHRLTVSTGPARVTEEVFHLYRKYQIGVHGDSPSEVTRDQFRRFLVDSPLIRQQDEETRARPAASAPSRPSVVFPVPYRRRTAGGGSGHSRDGEDSIKVGAGDDRANEEFQGQDSLSVPYGSYHQLYRIDGTLIAVGVVDILPKCLSSVYCFYDPDYRALALGKLTALKETEFVREACQVRPNLRHYYMGYYIHSCPKMSYKGSYTPSYLLCPERLSWVPLDLCRPVLDRQKYARLSDLLGPPSPPLWTAAGTGVRGGDGPDSASDGAEEASNDGTSHGDRSRRRVSQGRFAQSNGEDFDSRDGSESATGRRRPPPSSRVSPPSPPSPPQVPSPPSKRNVRVHSSRPRRGRGSSQGIGEGKGSIFSIFAGVDDASASGLNDIPIMVKWPPYTVTYGALTTQSQAVVRDVLRLYAPSVGPDLASRIVLKLHD